MATIAIVHVLHALSLGGAARATVHAALCSARSGAFRHTILSLTPGDRVAIARARADGLEVLDAPDGDTIDDVLAAADIVQLNFWNSPEVYALLRRTWPATRLLVWIHVAGDTVPQIVTPALVAFADLMVAGCARTADLAVLRRQPRDRAPTATALVWLGADFGRLTDLRPEAHRGLQVGYIGTLDFAKIHPEFVAMNARVDVDDVRFIVCGDGAARRPLQREAEERGVAARFEWLGYVEDIGAALRRFDIFGYPLCDATYASAELVLQEAMYAGIPPVILRRGGARDVVDDHHTGLVVDCEDDYVSALEFLARHPDERRRLGDNARVLAQKRFGGENTARGLNDLYRRLAARPKRTRRWSGMAVVGETDSGARHFIESLGEHAPAFRDSVCAADIEAARAADAIIRAAPPVLVNPGGGGIVAYRVFYPADRFLRLWSGLVFLQHGRPALAAAEFVAALRLGLDRARLEPYLTEAMTRAGAAAHQ